MLGVGSGGVGWTRESGDPERSLYLTEAGR